MTSRLPMMTCSTASRTAANCAPMRSTRSRSVGACGPLARGAGSGPRASPPRYGPPRLLATAAPRAWSRATAACRRSSAPRRRPSAGAPAGFAVTGEPPQLRVRQRQTHADRLIQRDLPHQRQHARAQLDGHERRQRLRRRLRQLAQASPAAATADAARRWRAPPRPRSAARARTTARRAPAGPRAHRWPAPSPARSRM